MKLNNEQACSLMGRRRHSLSLIRRPAWLKFDPKRRPALVREIISIKNRLHSGVAGRAVAA